MYSHTKRERNEIISGWNRYRRRCHTISFLPPAVAKEAPSGFGNAYLNHTAVFLRNPAHKIRQNCKTFHSPALLSPPGRWGKTKLLCTLLYVSIRPVLERSKHLLKYCTALKFESLQYCLPLDTYSLIFQRETCTIYSTTFVWQLLLLLQINNTKYTQQMNQDILD